MKNFILFLVMLTLISCKKKVEIKEKQPVKTLAQKVWISKNQKFLDQFKSIDFDTLKVFSGEGVYNSNFEFYGKKISPNDASIFPKEYNIFEDNKVETYAVYKFDINEKTLGLIARTPSEYWPTSIKLFIYDKVNEKITNYSEVAESWGDAGDVLIKKSWLFKNKKDVNCFVWVYYAHDNSVDEDLENPSFTENHYFLLKLNKGKIDTISKNNKELKKQFSKILRRESI